MRYRGLGFRVENDASCWAKRTSSPSLATPSLGFRRIKETGERAGSSGKAARSRKGVFPAAGGRAGGTLGAQRDPEAEALPGRGARRAPQSKPEGFSTERASSPRPPGACGPHPRCPSAPRTSGVSSAMPRTGEDERKTRLLLFLFPRLFLETTSEAPARARLPAWASGPRVGHRGHRPLRGATMQNGGHPGGQRRAGTVEGSLFASGTLSVLVFCFVLSACF